jgi:hypothetical protein
MTRSRAWRAGAGCRSVDAGTIVPRRERSGMDVMGPVSQNHPWHTKKGGDDASSCVSEWQAAIAVCPQSSTRVIWTPGTDPLWVLHYFSCAVACMSARHAHAALCACAQPPISGSSPVARWPNRRSFSWLIFGSIRARFGCGLPGDRGSREPLLEP